MNQFSFRISRVRILALAGLFLFGWGNVHAFKADQGDPQGKQSLFTTMQYQDFLEVSLEIDMEALMANRKNDDAVEGKLTFLDVEGEMQSWKTDVKVRGKYRRTQCEAMPPLKLDFSKKALKSAGLAEFDDMKLVTHCIENDAEAKQLLLKEYLAYKLYNEITAASFEVQFLKITYIDSKTGKKKKNFAFLIEDTAELRARINAKKWKADSILVYPNNIDQEQLKKVALFESMIGNVDWDYRRGHNVKALEKNGKAIFIPYDFDFSGLVAAPYATLKTEIGQLSMNDRFYLAQPNDLDDLEEAMMLLKNHQEDFIEIIKKVKHLNLHSKREAVEYINNFFAEETQLKIPQNNSL